ncbi:MAG: hypothetical protein P8J30_04235 [Ilumatobacter sp.]|nr:hypothetical protein [Ilumatobacter sp.]
MDREYWHIASYTPTEARLWALSELSGCCGCVLPTFSADLSALNEAAIRHGASVGVSDDPLSVFMSWQFITS